MTKNGILDIQRQRSSQAVIQVEHAITTFEYTAALASVDRWFDAKGSLNPIQVGTALYFRMYKIVGNVL